MRPEDRPEPLEKSVEATIKAEVVVVEGAPSVMRPGTADLRARLSESSYDLRTLPEVSMSESENLKICWIQ